MPMLPRGGGDTAWESLASQFRASWTHQGISKLKGEEHQIALLPLLSRRPTDRAYPQRDTGECGALQEQRRPEPVAKMQFLSWKEIRVALILSLPTLPAPTPSHPPFPRAYSFLSKIYTWCLSRGEAGGGKRMKIYSPRSLQKRKKNQWRTNPKHLCFCPQNDKIILWTENRDFCLSVNVGTRNTYLMHFVFWNFEPCGKHQNAKYSDKDTFFF